VGIQTTRIKSFCKLNIMIKILSGNDIEFIKKAIRYINKNKHLNHADQNRADYLLNSLSNDESLKIFSDIVKEYEKTKNRKIEEGLH